MLEGTIDIKSEAHKGTEVDIQIPLRRAAGSSTPASTPSSVGSPDKLQENSISVLQSDHPSKTISIYTSSPNQDTDTYRAALNYVKKWFMLPCEPNPLEHPSDVVIVEENDLLELLKRLRPGLALLVLSNNTYLSQVAYSLYSGVVESMSTPFGPYKLAKAIRSSLEKADLVAASLTPQVQVVMQSPRAIEYEADNPKYSPMMPKTNDKTPTVQLQTDGYVTASRSDNACKALGSGLSGSSTESCGQFPFPSQGSSGYGSHSPHSIFVCRPKLSSRRTEPVP